MVGAEVATGTDVGCLHGKLGKEAVGTRVYEELDKTMDSKVPLVVGFNVIRVALVGAMIGLAVVGCKVTGTGTEEEGMPVGDVGSRVIGVEDSKFVSFFTRLE
jgi:hypothetical protein